MHFGKDGQCLIGSGQRIVHAELITSREYRTVGTVLRFNPQLEFKYGAIHPDSRLLVLPSIYGFHFWDLATGEEVATVYNEKRVASDHIFPSRDEFIVKNTQALITMRVINDGPNQSHFWFGQAREINRGGSTVFTCCAGCKTLVHALFPGKGVSLFTRDTCQGEWIRRPYDVPYYVKSLAVSPDGSLIATGSLRENTKTFVWSTADARKLAEYETVGATSIGFSPNGNWLAIRSHAFSQLIPIGNWERGKPLEPGSGKLCFSPASDLLAVETGTGAVQCYDPETSRQCARFEEPNQDIAAWLAFNPDGSRLVTSSNESRTIHVRDLRLIRQELAELGLDWEAPPIPAANVAEQPKTSLRGEFEPLAKK